MLEVILGIVIVDVKIYLPYLLNLQELSLTTNVESHQMETAVPVKRIKANNKSNEEKDISLIVSYLNDPIKGQNLRNGFAQQFPGRQLIAARTHDPSQKKKAGSRSVHYDFQIQLDDGSWWNIEHKGSQDYRKISTDLPPWTGGVQFFNGGLEKYRIAYKYAEQWYDSYIGTELLYNDYLDSSPSISIPTKDEWIYRDAKQQGNPKTKFGLELKRAVKKRGEKSLIKLRDNFVPQFFESLTDQDIEEFKEDVFPILLSSFEQKHAWLQIAGDLSTGNYYFKWTPSLSISNIHNISFSFKKDIDITIESDCEYPIRGILRWGKGAGFSNLRLDLK
jgi:hypothetical protein